MQVKGKVEPRRLHCGSVPRKDCRGNTETADFTSRVEQLNKNCTL